MQHSVASTLPGPPDIIHNAYKGNSHSPLKRYAAITAAAAAAAAALLMLQVRRIGPSAVGGFAGVAVDGLALLEKLEAKLEEHPGQLLRAAVELAKMWRQVGWVWGLMGLGLVPREPNCGLWTKARTSQWHTTLTLTLTT